MSRISEAEYTVLVPNANRREFWKGQPGLVWSNPNAPDSAFIRAALVRPRFSQLLSIAVEFGLARSKQEWAELLSEPRRDVERARAPVERIFPNIEKGFALAAAGD